MNARGNSEEHEREVYISAVLTFLSPLCVCRRACPCTCLTATTASPSSCASTSSSASEPLPPRGTSLRSTSQCCHITVSSAVSLRIWGSVLKSVCLCMCVCQVLGGRARAAVAKVWTYSGDEHSQHSQYRPSETGSAGHQTTLCMFPKHTYTQHVWQPWACQCVYVFFFFQITRRYAEFSSAIVSINQTIPNERTNTLLGQLQVKTQAYLWDSDWHSASLVPYAKLALSAKSLNHNQF